MFSSATSRSHFGFYSVRKVTKPTIFLLDSCSDVLIALITIVEFLRFQLIKSASNFGNARLKFSGISSASVRLLLRCIENQFNSFLLLDSFSLSTHVKTREMDFYYVPGRFKPSIGMRF